jgi:hypothetical protein
MSTKTRIGLHVKCPLLLPNSDINGSESANIKLPNIKLCQNVFSVSHAVSAVLTENKILIGVPEGHECT